MLQQQNLFDHVNVIDTIPYNTNNSNPLMPVVTKKSHIIKQTCSFQLHVCLSMRDLFVTTWLKKG